MVRKLRTATMPPAGSPRPDSAAYAAFASTVEAALDRAAAARPNPGRVPAVHRLNRFEYTNAIRDLLALEIDGDSILPDDESSYGFDNNASVLSLTPGAARALSVSGAQDRPPRLGDPTSGRRPRPTGWRCTRYGLPRKRRSLVRHTRGSAIRHVFPLDGEYVLKIGLRRDWSSPQIRGLDKREQIDIRLDGARVKLFEIGGECVGSNDPKCQIDKIQVSNPMSPYDRSADEALRVRFPATAGTRLVGVAFLNRNSVQEGVGPEYSPPRSGTFVSSVEGGMAMDTITIEGPFNAVRPTDSSSRRQIFVCRPRERRTRKLCEGDSQHPRPPRLIAGCGHRTETVDPCSLVPQRPPGWGLRDGIQLRSRDCWCRRISCFAGAGSGHPHGGTPYRYQRPRRLPGSVVFPL